MTVKLEDVAKLAGVSPTTVSRVINNYGAISDKTKKAVHAAMNQLNYRPNTLARSLQGKSPHLIGLIFYDVSHPFFGELVSRIENLLFERGYKAILCNSANDPKKEREYLRLLAANQVDGIIAGAHNENIPEYKAYGLPIVSFDRNLAPTISIVSSDNAQGGRLAASVLSANGVQAPLIITGKELPNSPTNARSQGFHDYFAAHGIESATMVIPFETAAAIRRTEIQRLLTKGQYDGIFCTDDLTAMQVHQQALTMGIRVPDDLKLIGYDGTRFIQNYYPALTTIVQPLDDIAKLLIDLLLKRINDHKADLDPNYLLPVSLHQGITA
ncbi:LacI family transcriptional regulator [Lacticaseibacillus casei]|uniref:LacI family DNA-binding transcriptional regulator n=1 Tax=Lacticaseibacillus casei TaxID=1582 RepID=UPI001109DB99|nr:LacI family DNA-binding transcriptional regulator [Lacticaseibacillus casei]TLQ51403.1 LacI family transcriptional regulator [Lacticaseibacillus casei]